MYLYERYTLDLMASAARTAKRTQALLDHNARLRAVRRAYILQRQLRQALKRRPNV